MSPLKIGICLIAIILLLAVQIQAAEKYERQIPESTGDLYFGSFGLGGGTFDEISLGLTVSYIHKSNIFTLGFIGYDEFHTMLDDHENGSCVQFTYGKVHRTRLALFSLSAGMGLVRGTTKEKLSITRYKYTDFGVTPGLILEGQTILRPTPVVGLGLSFFGNLNKDKSYAGVHVSIVIGKLFD